MELSNYSESDFYLAFKSEKGLKAKGKWDDVRYRDRLKEELQVITSMKFPDYFLVEADFITWAKLNDIPVGPGRGSAAGCLIAWALGITNVDPIKWNLLFVRFLNPGRISMPDIDTDFCMRRRPEVISYVKRKYGPERAMQIMTTLTIKARLAIKDVGRAMGFEPEVLNRYSNLVPDESRGGINEYKVTLKDCLFPSEKFALDHAADLKVFKQAYDTDPDFQSIINRAYEIEGLPRNTGVHAAGVVIWSQPIGSLVPVMRAKDADNDDEIQYVTQWYDEAVENVGLVKYDFLGLRTLTVIKDAIDSIEARLGFKIDFDSIAEDDTETFDTLCSGDTWGVFQLESDGMRAFVKAFQPRSIEEIAIISALYRPGPMDIGMVEQILNIRQGNLQPDTRFPEVAHILDRTNGVLTYQEQVLEIAAVYSGFTLSQADLLRRAMGKKKPEEMLAQSKNFVDGAKALGRDEDLAKELFNLIEKFSGYAFNKSHAIAYSILSYQTAYLKTHYPADYYAAIMSSYDDILKIRPHIAYVKTRGVAVQLPDVNLSRFGFTATDDHTIRFGLGAVKGCGDSAISNLIETRKLGPFKDLVDLCKRVDSSSVKKNNLIALAQAGALDSLEQMNRLELCEYIPNVMEAVKPEVKALKAGQESFFDVFYPNDPQKGIVLRRPKVPIQDSDILAFEKEVLGIHISKTPFDRYKGILKHRSIDQISSVTLPDLYVTILAVISDFKIKSSKNGSFAFVDLEDESGTISGKMWNKAYEKYGHHLHVGDVVLVYGKTKEYRGIEVSIESITPGELELSSIVTPIVLKSLSFPLIQNISCFSKGKIPIDLEIGCFRYRLGFYDVPENFKAQYGDFE